MELVIQNLAIQGGGIKAVAYVGALQVLEENKMLDNLQRLAGTSAGSLVAALLSAGYNANGVAKLMADMNIRKFKIGYNPFRLFTKYGLHSGNYILDFISSAIRNAPAKNFTEKSTFLDFHLAGCKELYIFATNMNNLSITEFSYTNTPNVPVAEAVRASMSIPVYFKAWRFTTAGHTEHLYADGGIAYNYPLSFFDDERFIRQGEIVNFESIGLYLQTPNNQQKALDHLTFNTPAHYFAHLFESLLEAQTVDFDREPNLQRRTIIIDDLAIPATNFNISQEDKNRLVASGRSAAQQFLAANEARNPSSKDILQQLN